MPLRSSYDISQYLKDGGACPCLLDTNPLAQTSRLRVFLPLKLASE